MASVSVVEQSHTQIDLQRLVWRAFFALLAIEVALLFLDAVIAYGGWVESSSIRRLIDLTYEDTIGTWLSSTLFFAVGLVVGLIHLHARTTGQPRGTAIGWGLIALFFVYLSFDDGSKFHERIGTFAGEFTAASSSWLLAARAHALVQGFPSYTWQLVFLPVFASIGLFLLVFLYRELGDVRRYVLVVAGLGWYVVAVAMDFLEGSSDGMALLTELFGAGDRTVTHFARSIEEFLEMFGTTLLLAAFLDHLASVTAGWGIVFVPGGRRRMATAPQRDGISTGSAGRPSRQPASKARDASPIAI